MPQEFPIVILGGNAPVVPYLMQRLKAQGCVAEVISRRGTSVPDGFTLTQMDLTEQRNWIAPMNAVVINLLPMWVLAGFLPRFIGIKAIIAHGEALRPGPAEDVLKSWAERSNVTWTLLRAAIVYDGCTDQNITRMARFIQRWHFLALSAPASGLRQPIHADDAARAVVAAMNNPGARNRAIDIAGGETLTYKEMALRVFAALGTEPRLVMLPPGWPQKSFEIAAELGLMKKSVATAFRRMNEDVICDMTEGLRLLDYQPRPFRPEFGSL